MIVNVIFDCCVIILGTVAKYVCMYVWYVFLDSIISTWVLAAALYICTLWLIDCQQTIITIIIIIIISIFNNQYYCIVLDFIGCWVLGRGRYVRPYVLLVLIFSHQQ